MKGYSFWFLFLWFCFSILWFYISNSDSKDSVKIQVWNKPRIISEFSWLQNITWELLISPNLTKDYYLNLLKSVKSNLDIQVYTLTYDEIKKFLRNLASWWVKIRIITESKKYKEQWSDFEKLKTYLEKYWVQVKSDENMWTNYIHTKLLLLDNNKFVIQTANITYSSFFKNREFFFVSDNNIVFDNLKKIFEKDWNWQKILKSDIHPNLLVCQIDCREKLEYYLNLAKSSIYIQTQDIEDKAVKNILKSKSNLDLKIIVADNDNQKLVDDFWKDKVKLMKKPYLHAKSILIDDKYLIVWSMNLTQNSIDNNREISLVLIDTDIISKYKESFDKDFK